MGDIGREQGGMRPLGSACAVSLAYVAALGLAAWVVRGLGVSGIAERLAGAAGILLAAGILGFMNRRTVRAGERRTGTARRAFCLMVLGLPFWAAAAGTLGSATATPAEPGQVLAAVLAGLAPGVGEEIIFRGIVFRGIVFRRMKQALEGQKERDGKKGHKGRESAWRTAALASSLLFALCHLFNAANQPAAATALQVYGAFGAGLCLCGIDRFSGTLAIPMLLHCMVDIASELAAGSAAAAASAGWADVVLATVFLAEGLLMWAGRARWTGGGR